MTVNVSPEACLHSRNNMNYSTSDSTPPVFTACIDFIKFLTDALTKLKLFPEPPKHRWCLRKSSTPNVFLKTIHPFPATVQITVPAD